MYWDSIAQGIAGVNLPSSFRWTDTVCIDQSNKREKSHQVQLMRDIYACASQVLVWLRESDKDMDLAITFLLRLDADAREAKDGKTAESWLFSRNLTDFVPAVPVLEKLFKKLWWYCMWTVQEPAAARAIPLVLCCQALLP
jgi:hypothetical protein